MKTIGFWRLLKVAMPLASPRAVSWPTPIGDPGCRFSTDYPEPVEPPPWASFSAPSHLIAEEYPAYAGAKYIEPCFKATFADGVRDTVLRFDRAEVLDGAAPELRVHLRDADYPLRFTLHYRVHEAYDLIERWVTATNQGDAPAHYRADLVGPVAPAARRRLPADPPDRPLAGRVAHAPRAAVPGVKVMESRRITTSHHPNPWFAVDRGTADEDAGRGLVRRAGLERQLEDWPPRSPTSARRA